MQNQVVKLQSSWCPLLSNFNLPMQIFPLLENQSGLGT